VLDQEIALLDAARDAVAAHDPARALRLLDDHRQRFPDGQLTQEATYVRVKALLERGSRAEAERTARQFLEAHPESPHAKRIRALFEP
jgi:TolA-binding protein